MLHRLSHLRYGGSRAGNRSSSLLDFSPRFGGGFFFCVHSVDSELTGLYILTTGGVPSSLTLTTNSQEIDMALDNPSILTACSDQWMSRPDDERFGARMVAKLHEMHQQFAA